jgi:hypothetical protein
MEDRPLRQVPPLPAHLKREHAGRDTRKPRPFHRHTLFLVPTGMNLGVVLAASIGVGVLTGPLGGLATFFAGVGFSWMTARHMPNVWFAIFGFLPLYIWDRFRGEPSSS